MKFTGIAMSAAGCLVATGCTLTKEVYYASRGPLSSVLEVRNVGYLSSYDSFTVQPFTNSLSGVTPQILAPLIQQRITTRLAADTVLRTEGKKKLTIRGKIVYCELKSLRQALVVPTEEVVCHVELLDPAGKLLGWAAIAGKIESRFRGASETSTEVDVAEGVAIGVVNWVNRHGVMRRATEE